MNNLAGEGAIIDAEKTKIPGNAIAMELGQRPGISSTFMSEYYTQNLWLICCRPLVDVTSSLSWHIRVPFDGLTLTFAPSFSQ